MNSAGSNQERNNLASSVFNWLSKLTSTLKYFSSISGVVNRFFRFLKFIPPIPWLSGYQMGFAVVFALVGIGFGRHITRKRLSWKLCFSMLLLVVTTATYPISVEFYNQNYPPGLLAQAGFAIWMVIHYSLIFFFLPLVLSTLSRLFKSLEISNE